MPLQGNIRDFSTTQLLNLINLARKTGTLTIFESVQTGEKDAMGNEKMAAGSERAKVSFNTGKLIFASMDSQKGNLVSVLNPSTGSRWVPISKSKIKRPFKSMLYGSGIK